jgi:uncharacterized membrane protein
MRRREDLSTPRSRRRLGVHYDPDQFGQFSEGVARFIGTARFLVFQSIFCIVWVIWNTFAPSRLRFDAWQFIGLTLLLSLQAAYAAPLILLAQNRQEDRDRSQQQADRDLNFRTQADTEFLAREVASIRVALSDVVTNDDLADRLEKLTLAIGRIESKLDRPET